MCMYGLGNRNERDEFLDSRKHYTLHSKRLYTWKLPPKFSQVLKRILKFTYKTSRPHIPHIKQGRTFTRFGNRSLNCNCKNCNIPLELYIICRQEVPKREETYPKVNWEMFRRNLDRRIEPIPEEYEESIDSWYSSCFGFVVPCYFDNYVFANSCPFPSSLPCPSYYVWYLTWLSYFLIFLSTRH